MNRAASVVVALMMASANQAHADTIMFGGEG